MVKQLPAGVSFEDLLPELAFNDVVILHGLAENGTLAWSWALAAFCEKVLVEKVVAISQTPSTLHVTEYHVLGIMLPFAVQYDVELSSGDTTLGNLCRLSRFLRSADTADRFEIDVVSSKTDVVLLLSRMLRAAANAATVPKGYTDVDEMLTDNRPIDDGEKRFFRLVNVTTLDGTPVMFTPRFAALVDSIVRRQPDSAWLINHLKQPDLHTFQGCMQGATDAEFFCSNNALFYMQHCFAWRDDFGCMSQWTQTQDGVFLLEGVLLAKGSITSDQWQSLIGRYGHAFVTQSGANRRGVHPRLENLARDQHQQNQPTLVERMMRLARTLAPGEYDSRLDDFYDYVLERAIDHNRDAVSTWYETLQAISHQCTLNWGFAIGAKANNRFSLRAHDVDIGRLLSIRSTVDRVLRKIPGGRRDGRGLYLTLDEDVFRYAQNRGLFSSFSGFCLEDRVYTQACKILDDNRKALARLVNRKSSDAYEENRAWNMALERATAQVHERFLLRIDCLHPEALCFVQQLDVGAQQKFLNDIVYYSGAIVDISWWSSPTTHGLEYYCSYKSDVCRGLNDGAKRLVLDALTTYGFEAEFHPSDDGGGWFTALGLYNNRRYLASDDLAPVTMIEDAELVPLQADYRKSLVTRLACLSGVDYGGCQVFVKSHLDVALRRCRSAKATELPSDTVEKLIELVENFAYRKPFDNKSFSTLVSANVQR
eukprot:TRINITY_DN10847_c0_g1_i1.p1 TRINITY_DN10847_c0_g1~~TRINITY_DN10847_c0_g1_i1.p1  ORF type:complete len:803 (+),score=84.91 TRINITY_DN10847_c0_g1_i1:285-2411(+)